MTLSDLQVHSMKAFSNAISCIVVQSLTRIHLIQSVARFLCDSWSSCVFLLWSCTACTQTDWLAGASKQARSCRRDADRPWDWAIAFIMAYGVGRIADSRLWLSYCMITNHKDRRNAPRRPAICNLPDQLSYNYLLSVAFCCPIWSYYDRFSGRVVQSTDGLCVCLCVL